MPLSEDSHIQLSQEDLNTAVGYWLSLTVLQGDVEVDSVRLVKEDYKGPDYYIVKFHPAPAEDALVIQGMTLKGTLLDDDSYTVPAPPRKDVK